MNLAPTIIPKSDQLNADDLLAGPRTIKITDVKAGSGEQPVSIHYEGDAGRPYKPGKSMRRVLVSIWGSEGGAYVGRRLKLYNDPEITFGPDKTGGIRISHASDIPAAVDLPLTVKRGKRKAFHVEPMAPEVVAPPPAPARPIAELVAAGDAIAEQGTESLQAWWMGTALTNAEKLLVKDKLAGWKQTAAAKGATS